MCHPELDHLHFSCSIRVKIEDGVQHWLTVLLFGHSVYPSRSFKKLLILDCMTKAMLGFSLPLPIHLIKICNFKFEIRKHMRRAARRWTERNVDNGDTKFKFIHCHHHHLILSWMLSSAPSTLRTVIVFHKQKFLKAIHYACRRDTSTKHGENPKPCNAITRTNSRNWT